MSVPFTRSVTPLLLLVCRKVSDVYFGLWGVLYFGFYKRRWLDVGESLRMILDPVVPAPYKLCPTCGKGNLLDREYRLDTGQVMVYRFDPRWQRWHQGPEATCSKAGYVGRRNSGFYRHMLGRTRWRSHTPTRHVPKMFFNAVASEDVVIWVSPKEISLKLLKGVRLYRHEIMPGDWDLAAGRLGDTLKYQSIVQHFQDAVPWDETVIFKTKYGPDIEAGRTAKGFRSLQELTEYYEARYSSLFRSIKNDGVRVLFDDEGEVDIPHVHIGRSGNILFGNDGNHRLAMAKILGVERIPCRVMSRHLDWQYVREQVLALGPERCWEAVGEAYASHPDLRDLVDGDDHTPETQRLGVLADLTLSSSALSPTISLRKLARELPPRSVILEVGTGLCGAAAQMAVGICGREQQGDIDFHCYDDWTAAPTDVSLASRRGVTLSLGETVLPHVRRSLEPFGIPIEVHEGKPDSWEWSGESISLYVDHFKRNPDLFWRSLQMFAPSWVLGETVVVFLDYATQPLGMSEATTYQQRFIESHSRSFESVVDAGIGVFRYVAPLDFDKASLRARIWALSYEKQIRDAELESLHASRSWRITAPIRWCSNAVRRTWLGSRQ